MADSAKRENLWLNLGLNVVLPALILSKGQGALERILDWRQVRLIRL